MAETKFVVIPDPRINPTSLLVVSPIKNRLRSSLLVLFNLGSGITSLRACLVVALMLLCSSNSFANPWLPKPGKWKYNLQYSKYTIPESIKFYEHDLYIRLDQKQALLSQELAQFNNNITTEIINQKAALLASNAQALEALPPQAQQDALTQIYAQNPDIQILYKRRNNIVTDIKNEIKQLKRLQEYLGLSYHHWAATTDIEYGLNNRFSYGVSIRGGCNTDKFKTSSNVDSFSIFLKRKLYDKKSYIFTLQPTLLTIGGMQGADITAMLGKSHKMKRKLFGKTVEVFNYSAFGITRFFGDNIIRKKIHADVTSGIKWNDHTILMNQESEDFNPEMRKLYKKVLRSQFTVAQDLNFASIEPRNKVYLTLSYFTIDSLEAKRRLSSGYSIGLWLEF